MEGYDILEVLEHIDPSLLDYQDWINVGMALKEEGYGPAEWDLWSRRDAARYHEGECIRKWNGFHGSVSPVTGGTIVQLAKDQGWQPEYGGRELDWDDMISDERGIVVDKNWIEGQEIREPEEWDPAAQLIRYLETLFEAGENVGYVTASWEKTDEKGTRWLPQKGSWDRTAGQLIEQLNHCGGDIGAVLGDYNPAAGAWIRFNPLDGNGCKNENVTEYRYALVESDSTDLEKQNAIIRGLELPIACLVFSGKKSLHAIVRVDAGSPEEYRKRVNYLYEICRKNGLEIDQQNRNPSRLSRMPGVMRNGHKQFLMDTNIGKTSWEEWQEWIESVNDDLPDPESLDSVWDNMPELSPCLIDGILRQGHKMLIAGPSKAGKSFLQIEMCIAIAEGRSWLGWGCTKGRVMYVNLELDAASCLHRFRDVYNALGWEPRNLRNIDIWNLRGKSVPMDRLAPKLIRRAAKKDYIAIVIDPIYKVITGDENSADQMANFCNQFDKVCTELGCAVIYCHHHSKGAQGGKRSMDRASGSGVFARDPDALLDLIELETTEELMKQQEDRAVCDACTAYLNAHFEDWEDDISQDDMLSPVQMLRFAQKRAKDGLLDKMVEEARKRARERTAWRIEGTLREFPKFKPVNLWFDYPVHQIDKVGVLEDIQPDTEIPPWKKGADRNKKNAKERKNDRKKALEEAVENGNFGDEPSVNDVAEYMGISDRTVRDRIKEHGGYVIEDGIVRKKECGEH
ncbi:MAG TPA: AAA family ATPase [Candidatus Eisenbergiella merdavium]|uniref:AAA family ATPase n=1 Tax=Candidatus Eisenbergiella merdavium TaxID=2838551 RepID=A0A9D2SQF7_9FIRM|nr:AAA family ATPase [Candidatus Eisenbergiella merdavium]